MTLPLHRFTSKDGLRVATVRKTGDRLSPVYLVDRREAESYHLSGHLTKASAIEAAREYCGLEPSTQK